MIKKKKLLTIRKKLKNHKKFYKSKYRSGSPALQDTTKIFRLKIESSALHAYKRIIKILFKKGSSETTRKAPSNSNSNSNSYNLKKYNLKWFQKQRFIFTKGKIFVLRNVLHSSPVLNSLNYKGRYLYLKGSQKRFSFIDYWNYMPSHVQGLLKKKPDKLPSYLRFLEWFIGFAEGDGCFWLKKQNGSQIPRLLFEVGQKDPKVLYWIKKMLGFGIVRSWTRASTGSVYWSYTVHSKPNVTRLIALFNGNLVLPKRRFVFNKWVEAGGVAGCLPLYFTNKQKNINKGVSVSLDTAWLSGFIDAEGCFYAKFSNSADSRIPRLKQKMHITQKSVFSEHKILEEIRDLFLSTTNVQRLRPNKKAKPELISEYNNEYENLTTLSSNYRVEISSVESQRLIIKYIRLFPLKTNKWIAFTRWERIIMARLRNDHLDEAKIPKLSRLAQSINNFFEEQEA